MDNQMTTELLPCPFCGGLGEIQHTEDYNEEWRHWIMCKGCAASTHWGYDTVAEAIAAWNQRNKEAEKK